MDKHAMISGIDTANLDRTCQPCEDFYQFTNGGWIAQHPLPPEYSRYCAAEVLALHNRRLLHEILEEAAANALVGSIEQKIGDFYASGMDETTIAQVGITPLIGLFARIEMLTDTTGLPPLLALLKENGCGGFFDFGSEPDKKNSSTVIAKVAQGGLGLPNRDYYLGTDVASVRLQGEYLAHITKIFTLIGESVSEAANSAAAVMKLETDLAQASLSPADMRDHEKLYHKMDIAGLVQLAPNFNWNEYFAGLAVLPEAINVNNPAFVAAFSKNLTRWAASQIRAYLRWHLVKKYASALPAPFEVAHFDFYSRTLLGIREQLPRWQRCVAATVLALGEALGKVYISRAFSPEVKTQVAQMVQTIIAVFRDEIEAVDWMSAATRTRALAKVDALTMKIAYPDKWRDYSALPISRGSYLENCIAAARFDTRRDLAKIDKPADIHEWFWDPSIVNACYLSSLNEIVFPAGILQPPYFNLDADPPVNYGGIGYVIAHEITHGFDDGGRQFDAQGNLVDWWNPTDAINFNERKQGVIDQFNALESIPGVHENGRYVVGEATADLGGVRIAYKAFERWQASNPRNIIDGFTPEQRFFLGFASVFASVQSDEYSRNQVLSNPHPHSKNRVNATLGNISEFAQAWNCSIGPMVRPKAEQCRIW